MWPNFVTVALVDFLLCQSREEKNRYTCGHKKCTIAFLWTVYFWRKELVPIWSQKLHCLLKFPKTIKSVQIIWYYNLLLSSSNIIKAEQPVIFHNNNYLDQQRVFSAASVILTIGGLVRGCHNNETKKHWCQPRLYYIWIVGHALLFDVYKICDSLIVVTMVTFVSVQHSWHFVI